MDEIYLKFPTIEDKDKWLDYIREYKNDNPKAKPLSYDEQQDYEEWLLKISNEHSGINLESGRIPSSAYFLMHGDRIIGSISIRHNINTDFLSLYGGHIGYGIRPSERRKGYATIMLHLGLEKCKELGLTDVMVSCRESNIGSAKTIENNFGVEKELIYIPEEDANFKKYWINIDESLKKYSGKSL